jgi:hypothetical protein
MPDDATPGLTAGCFQEETDMIAVILEATKDAVNAAYDPAGSWRKLGRQYGVPHHVLYAIKCGNWSHVSWDTVRLVRQRLGMDDPGPLHSMLACPTCGSVHVAGDCHGQPVAAVVILAPGETVRTPGKPRKRKHYHRPCMDDATWDELTRHKDAGETWGEFLLRLLDLS